jgi:hypothetical protein
MLKHLRALAALSSAQRRLYIAETLRGRKTPSNSACPPEQDLVLLNRARVERATFAALRRYVPRNFAGLLSLFLPSHEWARSWEEPLRWQSVAQQTEEYFGPQGCTTDIMLLEPHAPVFAGFLRKCRTFPGTQPDRAVPLPPGHVAFEPA